MKVEIQIAYIVIALLVSGVSVIVFKKVNEFFSKYDNNEIVVTNKLLVLYMTLMFGLNFLLLNKFELTITYVFIFFLILYLSICSYIDYKIKMVYTVLSVVAGTIGLIFFIYAGFTCHAWERLNYADVIAFAVVMGVCKVKKLFGGGDWDVFLVITLFICSLPNIYFPIEKVLFIMLIASIIQLIATLDKVEFPKMKLKESTAFVPSIFLSVVINLLI